VHTFAFNVPFSLHSECMHSKIGPIWIEDFKKKKQPKLTQQINCKHRIWFIVSCFFVFFKSYLINKGMTKCSLFCKRTLKRLECYILLIFSHFLKYDCLIFLLVLNYLTWWQNAPSSELTVKRFECCILLIFSHFLKYLVWFNISENFKNQTFATNLYLISFSIFSLPFI